MSLAPSSLLSLDAMSGDEFQEAVMHHNVFACVFTQNKIQIMQVQKQSTITTYNGIFNAQALNAADMIVALDNDGADVVHETFLK